MSDLPPTEALVSYIDHFQHRVVQDAITEATSHYWLRRAAVFEWARPRVGDYRGLQTPAEFVEADQRCKRAAEACRAKAVAMTEYLGMSA